MAHHTAIETIERNGHVAELHYEDDTSFFNPRSNYDCNMGTMVCHHGRYNLGDDKKKWECPDTASDYCDGLGDTFETWAKNPKGYEAWEQACRDWNTDSRSKGHNRSDGGKKPVIREVRAAALWLKLWLYDHGGITMSSSREGDPFSCGWDSGQVGYIYVTHEKAVAGGYDPTTEEGREKIYAVLEGEVAAYDQYLTGDIYYVCVKKITTCDQGHEHDETVESCGGFFGMDYAREQLTEMLTSIAGPAPEPEQAT